MKGKNKNTRSELDDFVLKRLPAPADEWLALSVMRKSQRREVATTSFAGTRRNPFVRLIRTNVK